VSGYLLDTNVLSETVKPQANASVLAWLEASDEQLFHVSVLTLGEIRSGIDSAPLSARRTALESWLSRDLMIRFAGRILGVNQEIADRWGRITAKASVAGRPVPAIDSLLAATALHHNLTLVTRNAKHASATGAPFFNPWES
jgi:predicted nucleic acid-binding protein